MNLTQIISMLNRIIIAVALSYSIYMPAINIAIVMPFRGKCYEADCELVTAGVP